MSQTHYKPVDIAVSKVQVSHNGSVITLQYPAPVPYSILLEHACKKLGIVGDHIFGYYESPVFNPAGGEPPAPQLHIIDDDPSLRRLFEEAAQEHMVKLKMVKDDRGKLVDASKAPSLRSSHSSRRSSHHSSTHRMPSPTEMSLGQGDPMPANTAQGSRQNSHRSSARGSKHSSQPRTPPEERGIEETEPEQDTAPEQAAPSSSRKGIVPRKKPVGTSGSSQGQTESPGGPNPSSQGLLPQSPVTQPFDQDIQTPTTLSPPAPQMPVPSFYPLGQATMPDPGDFGSIQGSGTRPTSVAGRSISGKGGSKRSSRGSSRSVSGVNMPPENLTYGQPQEGQQCPSGAASPGNNRGSGCGGGSEAHRQEMLQKVIDAVDGMTISMNAFQTEVLAELRKNRNVLEQLLVVAKELNP